MSKIWEQPLVKIILGGAVISIAVLPFVISEVTFFPGNFARAILFRIIVEILLVMYVALIFIDKKYLPPLNLLTLLVSGWWLILGLSTILSPQPRFAFWGGVERMEGLFTMSHYFLFFFILAGTLKERKYWLLFLNTGIGASALMAGIAILQRLDLAFTHPVLIGMMRSRASGTLENPLFLSSYLIFFIFLTLTLFFFEKTPRRRLFYGGILILQILALLATDTRGGEIAFLAGILFFALLYPSSLRHVRYLKIGIALLFIGVLLTVLALGINKKLAGITEMLPFAPRLLTYATDMNLLVASLDQRLDVWDLSWRGFIARPILGYGPENFTLVMDRFFPAHLNIFFREQWLEKGLNIVLDTLLTGGIAGLLVYLAIFGTLAWQLVLKNKWGGILPHGISILVFAYLVQNLVNFDTTITYILFFSILALGAFLIHTEVSSHQKEGSPGPEAAVKSKTLPYGVVWTCIMTIMGSIFLLNIQPLLAHRTLIETVHIAKENPKELRKATNYFNTHLPRLLRNGNILAYDNSLYQTLVALDQITTVSASQDPTQTHTILKNAVQLIEKEVKLKPDFSKPYFLLAKFYTKMREFDAETKTKAKENFEKATELSPNRYMFWLEWAKSDPLLGTPTEAVLHGKKAISLITGPEQNISEAYFWTGIGYIYAGKLELAQEYVKYLKSPSSLAYLENTYRLTNNYAFLVKTFYPERIKEDPQNLQWRASLAITYLKMGERVKACEEVRRLLKEPNIEPGSRQGAEEFIKLNCR